MTRQEQIEELRGSIEYYDDVGNIYNGLARILKAARQHLKLLQDLESGKVRIVPVKSVHPMDQKAAESYVPQPDAPTVPICDILDCSPNLNYRIIETIYQAMVKAAPEYRFED